MSAGTEWLQFYGESSVRSPWAVLTPLASLAYTTATLKRLIITYRDSSYIEAHTEWTVPASAGDTDIRAFIASLQALTDMSIVGYHATPYRFISSPVTAHVIDGSHAYADVRWLMKLVFLPSGAGPLVNLFLPGIKQLYVAQNAQLDYVLNIADPDIVAMAAVAARVLVNSSNQAIATIYRGIMRHNQSPNN